MTLYVDGEVAGCSRVFPEELERTAAPEAPKSPVCELDEGVVGHPSKYLSGALRFWASIGAAALRAR